MKVRFHLPGISGHFRLNLLLAAMLENCPHFFREGVEIASVYGIFPPSIWNGGRMQGGTCDQNFVRAIIKSFNDINIPLRFTFTNPLIEEEHLSDDFCNMVMNMANNGLNEVIVVSPVLEDYIRKYYPKYKITSSTCKRITDADALSQELEKDYHIVVIDYDLNNKFDILEKLPNKDKCELLVNACCQPGCKRRVEHYRSIGEQQLAYGAHLKKHPYAPDASFDLSDYTGKPVSSTIDCPSMDKTIFDIKELSTHISPDDIWNKYVPMGFSQFKIEGRTTGLFNLVETYIYYMIKPECAQYARYMLLKNLTSNGVLSINE